MQNDLMRNIPKVDALCALPCFDDVPAAALTESVRAVLSGLRDELQSGAVTEIPGVDELSERVLRAVEQNAIPSLRPVINATGVVLHTNLGRACLSDAAAKAAASVAASYSTLEYDAERGERGSRYSHVERLICRLTGAESAIAVNNNAAAVLLILSAMTKGKEVVISRGELVEIGGSFRVPEVMEQGGCILREVGATNKTHLADYENAINDATGALLKVHTSNYRIVGFSESVPLSELVELGRRHRLPVIEDLGSGALLPLERFGITGEPCVQGSVAAGADVICFSGDKLLGGPQAGIIIGKKKHIETLKKHPLMRAFRIDKLTLAALEATLRAYLDERGAVSELPVLRMLAATADELREKAKKLIKLLAELPREDAKTELIPSEGQVGGGSVPHQALPSWAVAIEPLKISVDELETRLRLGNPAVIGRINRGLLLLDARTLFERDFPVIARAVVDAIGGETL